MSAWVCADWFVLTADTVWTQTKFRCVSVRKLCGEWNPTSKCVFKCVWVDSCWWFWMHVTILTRLTEKHSNTPSSYAFRKLSTGDCEALLRPLQQEKWCSAFVTHPCFLNWLHPLGIVEHNLQTSMRNTLTKQTTNSRHGYRNADNVSVLYFFSSSLFPCLYPLLWYQSVFGIFCCSVWMFRSIPRVLMGKK